MEKYKLKIGNQILNVELEKDGAVIVDPQPPVSTGFKIGVNSFPWFPMSKLKSIGMQWARVYCSSGWIWQPGGLFIEPMFRAETQENHGIDSMLLKAKENGVNVLLTIHQVPEWYRNTGRGDGANDMPPIKAGAKRDDPASYKDYAEFLFQVSARYGRVKHSDSILKIDTTPRWSGDIPNAKKSGLDLLTYIEPWNEPDKFWLKGTDAYFEPEETAAMMSACYDGHEGKLGAGVGIVIADPSMKVIMPGLTDYNFDYFKRMVDWFYANRKTFPASIINWHHYSNIGNRANQIPAQWANEGACLPANDQAFNRVKDAVHFSKSVSGDGVGLPCWITEMGADKVAPSMMLAKGINGKSNEQFQAEIIIESIKAYKSAGVDAVFVFNAPDENGATDGGQFESCGLWSSEATGYKPFIAANELAKYLADQTPKVAQMKPIKAAIAKRPMLK